MTGFNQHIIEAAPGNYDSQMASYVGPEGMKVLKSRLKIEGTKNTHYFVVVRHIKGKKLIEKEFSGLAAAVSYYNKPIDVKVAQ